MKGWRLGDRERAEGKKQWKRKFYEKLRRRKETGRLGGWCNFEPEGSSLTKQSSLCTLVHVCTHTHTRTRNTLFYTQPHAGGTNKASVPICCAPGLLSGDSQTGIQPCQHWHWSHTHTHTHMCMCVRAHTSTLLHCCCRHFTIRILHVCMFFYIFIALERQMLEIWENVYNTAVIFTEGK